MTDPSQPPRSNPPGAPRWAKVSAIVVGVLILLAVVVKLTGLGGDHGPGRHMGNGDTASTGVTVIQTSSGHPAAYAPEGHR
ncbi:hypothetical protein ACLB9X_25690 [Streptomyces sp. 5K101]|uniref:hypothetical protein n=1 Tax=Streptomyces sp. 5K101 TaxID=3390037 RepID=UPI003976A8DF